MNESIVEPRRRRAGRRPVANRMAPVLAAAALATGACASAPATPEAEVSPRAVIPQPEGEHYLIHYVDATGVRRRDTRDRVDSVLVPSTGAVQAVASPAGGRIAAAVARGDSTVLVVIDVGSGAVTQVHASPTRTVYTLEWSPAGQLGAGYYGTAERQSPGGSGVFIVGAGGDVRDVGCSVSNRFTAWVANGNVVVGDGRNLYVVSAQNCRTLATIPLHDKRDVTYSPNGRKVFLYRSPVDQFSREQAGNRLELHVADYNGANSRRVTDYRYSPRNARWSPDGRKIAFELQSQRFANLRHVAVYDLGRDQATFDAKARSLGQPDDGNPFWSPSGAKLVHDRAYARRTGGQAYSTNQKVVKVLPAGGATLSNSEETVVAEELSQDGTVTGEPVGRTWGWIDENRIAFTSRRWTRILNVDAGTAYDLPPGVGLVSVVVVESVR